MPWTIAQSIEWLAVYDIAMARAEPKLTPYFAPSTRRSNDFHSCLPPQSIRDLVFFILALHDDLERAYAYGDGHQMPSRNRR
jgi:hypothetical protein